MSLHPFELDLSDLEFEDMIHSPEEAEVLIYRCLLNRFESFLLNNNSLDIGYPIRENEDASKRYKIGNQEYKIIFEVKEDKRELLIGLSPYSIPASANFPIPLKKIVVIAEIGLIYTLCLELPVLPQFTRNNYHLFNEIGILLSESLKKYYKELEADFLKKSKILSNKLIEGCQKIIDKQLIIEHQTHILGKYHLDVTNIQKGGGYFTNLLSSKIVKIITERLIKNQRIGKENCSPFQLLCFFLTHEPDEWLVSRIIKNGLTPDTTVDFSEIPAEYRKNNENYLDIDMLVFEHTDFYNYIFRDSETKGCYLTLCSHKKYGRYKLRGIIYSCEEKVSEQFKNNYQDYKEYIRIIRDDRKEKDIKEGRIGIWQDMRTAIEKLLYDLGMEGLGNLFFA